MTGSDLDFLQHKPTVSPPRDVVGANDSPSHPIIPLIGMVCFFGVVMVGLVINAHFFTPPPQKIQNSDVAVFKPQIPTPTPKPVSVTFAKADQAIWVYDLVGRGEYQLFPALNQPKVCAEECPQRTWSQSGDRVVADFVDFTQKGIGIGSVTTTSLIATPEFIVAGSRPLLGPGSDYMAYQVGETMFVYDFKSQQGRPVGAYTPLTWVNPHTLMMVDLLVKPGQYYLADITQNRIDTVLVPELVANQQKILSAIALPTQNSLILTLTASSGVTFGVVDLRGTDFFSLVPEIISQSSKPASLAVSPDGLNIAIAHQTGIELLSLQGEKVGTVISNLIASPSICWLPSGEIIIAGVRDAGSFIELYRIDDQNQISLDNVVSSGNLLHCPYQ